MAIKGGNDWGGVMIFTHLFLDYPIKTKHSFIIAFITVVASAAGAPLLLFFSHL